VHRHPAQSFRAKSRRPTAVWSPAAPQTRRFERLIAEISGAFVRATADEIDTEINRYLKKVCLLLGLDRATLSQADPLERRGRITHAWARDEDRKFPTSLDPDVSLPWHAKKMQAGEIIVYSNLDELPAEAAIDRETLRPLGPESAVVVPVRVRNMTIGAVAFGALDKQRHWPAKLVERFRLIADIFGYALERKWNETHLLRLQKNWPTSHAWQPWASSLRRLPTN
jgi:GAF domain-containing protein